MDKHFRKELLRLRCSINDLILAIKDNNDDYGILINSNDIKKSDNSGLQSLHMKIHSIWNSFKKGQKVGRYNRTTITQLHINIVKELFKRKLDHSYISDLDDTLSTDFKKKTKGSKEFALEKKREEELAKKKEQEKK